MTWADWDDDIILVVVGGVLTVLIDGTQDEPEAA